MYLRIVVSVQTDTGPRHITVDEADIEDLVKEKAKKQGIEGRSGRFFRHLSPSIQSVSYGDLYTPPQTGGTSDEQ